MALRDRTTGRLLAFRACADELAAGRLALIERSSAHTTLTRIDGNCPIHHTTDCVATYMPASRVAGWSLREFWGWRRHQHAAVTA